MSKQFTGTEQVAGAIKASDSIVQAFGEDALSVLLQFLLCDEAGQAELMRTAAELARPNGLRHELYPDLSGDELGRA